MKRPRRPRSSNLTWPVTSAKSVSSLPWPTFSPGWCLVPRWRIRIVPAWTNWPPKRFTPSRCPCESRPFTEEPPPFLCAIRISLGCEHALEPAENCTSLELDAADLDGSIILPVTARDLVLAARLKLQDRDFWM